MGWARIFVSLILWILLSITCAPLFLLLCIYRFILGKVVPLLYKDVERLLTTTSSNLFMANGKSFHTAICLGFEGKLELNEARSKFESSVIYKKDSKGQLQWPELQQFVVNKFGHVFWQWDPIFTIKNHFRVLEGNDASNAFLSPQDVLNLLDTSILAKEFPASRSPWEVVIIPNFKDIPKLGEAVGYEGTVLVFHFDHCLGNYLLSILLSQPTTRQFTFQMYRRWSCGLPTLPGIFGCERGPEELSPEYGQSTIYDLGDTPKLLLRTVQHGSNDNEECERNLVSSVQRTILSVQSSRITDNSLTFNQKYPACPQCFLFSRCLNSFWQSLTEILDGSRL